MREFAVKSKTRTKRSCPCPYSAARCPLSVVRRPSSVVRSPYSPVRVQVPASWQMASPRVRVCVCSSVSWCLCVPDNNPKVLQAKRETITWQKGWQSQSQSQRHRNRNHLQAIFISDSWFFFYSYPAILVSSRQYACAPACWCSCVSGTFSSAADSWQRVDFRGMTARDAATTTTISISISIATASYNSSLNNRA